MVLQSKPFVKNKNTEEWNRGKRNLRKGNIQPDWKSDITIQNNDNFKKALNLFCENARSIVFDKIRLGNVSTHFIQHPPKCGQI